MDSIALVIAVVVLSIVIAFVLRRRSYGLVAKRGLGVAADLGALADTPRVQITSLTDDGPARVVVVFEPEGASGVDRTAPAPGQTMVVSLDAGSFGSGLLRDWYRDRSVLAMATAPGSRIVRLRALDSLQPLTLRRLS